MSVVKDWCNTQVKFVKLQYIWTINNFDLVLEETGESLKSSIFSVNGSVKWCLRLFPRGQCEETKDFLSLYLQAVSLDKNIKIRMKFSIMNSKREHTNITYASRLFTEVEEWGFKKFIRRDALHPSLLPDDKLTIFCELYMIADTVNISSESNKSLLDTPDSCLTKDLSILFESPKFSDVTLFAGGCEFKAHKDILSARSPVFAAMFEHEMEEQKKNKVEITDIDQEVFKEMLRFIYTGKVFNMKKIAEDLLIAADKYALEKLKIKCEGALYKNLSIENVVTTLIFADAYRADQLKTQAIEFIKTHAKEVLDSAKWKSMSKSRVPITFHLFSEMFQGFF